MLQNSKKYLKIKKVEVKNLVITHSMIRDLKFIKKNHKFLNVSEKELETTDRRIIECASSDKAQDKAVQRD